MFLRIVSPTRSFTGDNADAVYFETPVSGAREYLVHGNLAGAVYTSFTMEAGAADGKYATAHPPACSTTTTSTSTPTATTRSASAAPPAGRNWLAIPPDGGRITTRHYFEWPTSASASQTLHVPLSIATPSSRSAPRPGGTTTRVAAALSRVINHVRGKTVDAPSRAPDLPSWRLDHTRTCSTRRSCRATMAFAASDAAYSMAPYRIGPDEALVITGRWPDVPLRQRLPVEPLLADVRLRQPSGEPQPGQHHARSRRQLPHGRSPTTIRASANWIDTEGRPSGTVFWRFFLPEGPIVTPQAEVVPFASLG